MCFGAINSHGNSDKLGWPRGESCQILPRVDTSELTMSFNPHPIKNNSKSPKTPLYLKNLGDAFADHIRHQERYYKSTGY